MCNFKVLNKMFRNERMAKGIRFNVYKCNVERKILLNAYSFSRCKWDSDVSKAKFLHEAAKQKVVQFCD
jgi:hypothetical protein